MITKQIAVHPGGVALDADLDIPEEAAGLVIFAHGSGSSRRSPRNRQVAEALQSTGFATLLFDLLTVQEERDNAADASLRFDIDFLAERLTAVIDEVTDRIETAELRVGLFGSSTGAAAALRAAAGRPETVVSVVSRSGRPDLAGEHLAMVRAPTLLLVGGLDDQVIEFNRDAAARLTAPHKLSIVAGATHLFEEPGTLEEVSRRATAWFEKTLARP